MTDDDKPVTGGASTSELPQCNRCGTTVIERPLALKCPKCSALTRKPGIDYGDADVGVLGSH